DRLGTGPGGEPSAVQVPHLPMRFYDPRRRLEEARRPLVGASSSFLPYGPDTNSTRGNPAPGAGRARAEAELPHIDPRRGVLSTELGLTRVERIEWLPRSHRAGAQHRLRAWCLRRAQPILDLGQDLACRRPARHPISGVKVPARCAPPRAPQATVSFISWLASPCKDAVDSG